MFTQKCFIRENTPLIRKKLESIGASICGCVEYGIGNCISFNKGIVHKFSFNFEYGETYKPNILKEIENFIDCDHNEDLFIAICSLRDDSDINQFFVAETNWKVPNGQIKHNNELLLCKEDVNNFNSENIITRPIQFRKATINELIEHFEKLTDHLKIDSMESNVVTGGIFEYCQKLGISFSDVLKRKSRDRKAVLIEGMYMVMLERNGFDSDQIASLTNIEKKRVNQKLEAIRDAIVKKESLAIKLYEIVKQITVKNGALNY